MSIPRFALWSSLASVVAVAVFLPGPAPADVGDRSTDGVWTEIAEAAVPRTGAPPARPVTYRVFELGRSALDDYLAGAPTEFVLPPESGLVLTLPMPDGSFDRFAVVESSLLSPALSAEYPDIRTYAGQGIDDPTATVRFDLTMYGFRAQILSAGGTVLIDPFQPGDTLHYISYSKRDFPRDGLTFECGVRDQIERLLEVPLAGPSGDNLSTYRLAVTATGEYTQYFGGVSEAQAQITTTFNRVTGIYERDVAISFNLTDTVIFEDPDDDPFPNGTSVDEDLLDQNQDVLDDEVGSDNYDVGHIVSQGGSGGLAAVGVTCNDGQKGRGGTSREEPFDDPFDVDFVAHEVGHQCGGHHTFNGTTGSCGNDNRNENTAYEPGSGTTIMAYAGICGDEDVQDNSDDYFHGISLDEIIAHRDGGGNCADVTATGNSPPTVDAGLNYTIPTDTPFRLTALGSDPDGDAVTYCWEQFDLGDASPPPNNANGPLFRSRQHTTDPTRTLPQFEDILSGADTPWELLPTVDRDLNFRVTVRDNRANGGGINDDAMEITVAGPPFFVESPNGGETFYAGCELPVSWTVGGGDVAERVNILYSTDGGSTWTTLAEDILNDGEAHVVTPCGETSEARIMVEAADNIFFDVSDDDFNIIHPTITADADVQHSFSPPNPWTMEGVVVYDLEVSSDADLYNVRFVADVLQCLSMACESGDEVKKLDGVEFVPEKIGFIAANDPVTVEVKITVPVGQPACLYEGEIHVFGEPECGCPPVLEQTVDVEFEVEPIVDMDVDDNHGTVSDNILHLKGAKGDLATGSFTIVNPNSEGKNVDLADGPGNLRIDPVDLTISDLVKVGDPAVIIASENVTTDDLNSLGLGEAQEVGLSVLIPDGIPVNAYYAGTVSVSYEGCVDGPVVSDEFAIKLHVLPTQGTLDILEASIEEEFCPDDPWTMVGQVKMSFVVQANGDHRNIRVSSGGLKHETLDKKLDDFNFFPEEIAFLAAGETRTVNVITKIPIGQHSGIYTDYFRVVSESAGEDSVEATIEICPVYDMDIKDHYANLGDNIMEIQATAQANESGGEWTLRAFDIGLPSVLVNNHDEFDGPGNAPVDCIECEFAEWSALWQEDNQGLNYHPNMHFTGTGSVMGDSCDWNPGDFRRMLVGLFVPKMTASDNHSGTYRGRLDCWALAGVDTVSRDYFEIEIQLARVVDGAPKPGVFGGYTTAFGAEIYWGDFSGVGLTGPVTLYRQDPGGGDYVRLNETPLSQKSSYLDTGVEPGLAYGYRIGIRTLGEEVLIGPISVGGAPDVFLLGQNTPNPFRATTTIKYQLPAESRVSLKIYDLSGRLTRTLRDGPEPPGYYSVIWDRRDQSGHHVANGIYFYRLETSGFTATKKMILLR